MKIGIVGTGAMGSVYAGLLGDAGNEVWAIDQWAEHIDTIRNKGLRLEGKSGDRTVKMGATMDASEVGPCDLVIISTKAMLLDHLAGRPGEIDAINGAIPPEGEKVDVQSPFNVVVSSLVRAKEKRLGFF